MNEYEITNGWKTCTYTFLADDDETAALIPLIWDNFVLSYFVKNINGDIIVPQLRVNRLGRLEKWYEKKYKKTVMCGLLEKKGALYHALASMKIKKNKKYYYSKRKREKFLMFAERRKKMNNKLFEFTEAAPNRYIAHFYKKCTVVEFLETILESKPKDHGCIVIFESKNRPLGNYHYKNGEIIHDFADKEISDKTICIAFGNGNGTSMDYTLFVS